MSLVLEAPPKLSWKGVSRWWLALDKPILVAALFLVFVGIVLIFSMSPEMAGSNADPFGAAQRQSVALGIAALLAAVISTGTPREIRRFGVLLFVVAVILLAATLLFGQEHGAAKRWLSIFNTSIQPSEFAKPALIAVSAWFFSMSSARGGSMRPAMMALACLLVVVALVALEPDYSQSVVLIAGWLMVLFFAGASMLWAVSAGILLLAGGAVAYAVSPHVAQRIHGLRSPDACNGREQIDYACLALREGGWFGAGPGEGVLKARLPDAHSDFAIAVVASEYGVVAVLAVLVAFAIIVARGLLIAGALSDQFARLAAAGLAAIIGIQALVHVGVTARLVFPTGMNLPLVSHGGSSAVATGILIGMLLGLTRRDLEREA